MSNTQNNNSLPQLLADNFQKMATVSIEAMQPIIKNMSENMSGLNKSMAENGIPLLNVFGSGKKSKCCPPEQGCPPHCIATIKRRAMAGERIIEPIMVINNCSTQKTYRVGVRELKNLDGTPAPSQPILDKATITLAPGRREQILLTLDLSNFSNGNTYEAEIVLREQDINQNICFTLQLNDNAPTEASPQNEKKYKLKWQDWQSHFYCEPPPKACQYSCSAVKPVLNPKKMSKEKDDFSKDVESIFRKTVDINKQYLKQGTALFKEVGNSERGIKNINPLRSELMMDAFTALAKMNLDHYRNLMDLGFALTKKKLLPPKILKRKRKAPKHLPSSSRRILFPGRMSIYGLYWITSKKIKPNAN